MRLEIGTIFGGGGGDTKPLQLGTTPVPVIGPVIFRFKKINFPFQKK